MIKKEKRLKHPRPQMMRKSFLNLNGPWEFMFDVDNVGINEKWYIDQEFNEKIEVPFVYQSSLSGIDQDIESKTVWYKKIVDIELDPAIDWLIHFEAVDYSTRVWVNGEFVGKHDGGFTPFSYNIKPYLIDGKNEIVVRVYDTTSVSQTLGKQSWKKENFLCWYTRTTGIWGSVWMEQVPKKYIEKFYLTPDIDTGILDIELYVNDYDVSSEIEVEIRFKDNLINKATHLIKDGKCNIRLDVSSNDFDFRLKYWSPESPELYDLKLSYKTDEIIDEVVSYFGMRKIHSENRKILLNNEEFYQKLVLNQGYYGEGLMTPPDISWLENDVKKIKALGFNGVRMHQKIEDNRFAYLCDYYGLVMWAEMPSFYDYNKISSKHFIEEVSVLIDKHYNNPSVIIWTLLNESWGVNEVYDHKKQQNYINALYYYVKSRDDTRLVIGNDGWEHTKTDILSIHDYSADQPFNQRYNNIDKFSNGVFSKTSLKQNYSKGYYYNDEPILISEFGGIAYSNNNSSESWGYGSRLNTKEDVLTRFRNLVEDIHQMENICGYCYTQLTDVEQEINGLLDEQHNEKFKTDEIRSIILGKDQKGFIFE